MDETRAPIETHSVVALADFVISSFREKLALWYDEFRGVYLPHLLNGALLSDGENFLLLMLEEGITERSLNPSQFRATLHSVGGHITVYGWMREDSRRIMSNATLSKIVNDAEREILQSPSSMFLDRAIALLSMEVRYDESVAIDPRDALEELIGRAVNSCPEYRGKYADQSGHTILREPGVWWGQTRLDPRVREADLISRLQRELPTLPTRVLGTQRNWPTNGSSCLRSIGLLARFF